MKHSKKNEFESDKKPECICDNNQLGKEPKTLNKGTVI